MKLLYVRKVRLKFLVFFCVRLFAIVSLCRIDGFVYDEIIKLQLHISINCIIINHFVNS